ncbi:ATP-binding protein [Azohydromonas aeria]|uniref:ATP-binding protein n=1 Tax=Azohydromonas aeria TaxID=2590212 RepID=UPI001E503CB1|nr:ATP-binding protein [Azohydromonas aeria]
MSTNPDSEAMYASRAAVPPPRWRDVARQRSMLLVLAVSLLIAAWVAFGLLALRQQAMNSELRTLDALSAALAAQADGTLTVAETALRATADGLGSGALVPGSREAQDTLRARASALPMFRELLVLDAEGREVASSSGEPPGPGSHAAAPYFLLAREDNDATLHVGLPQQLPGSREPVVPLSWPWHSAQGNFNGLVVLLADAEFLDAGFALSAPTPDTGLQIYRPEGGVLSDGPGENSARVLAPALSRALWDRAEVSKAHLVDEAGNRQRLVAPHLLKRAPLLLVVTRDADAVLSEWRQQARLVAAFVSSALLVTLVLSLRSVREQQWRRASEAVLAAERERTLRALQAAREGVWEWNPATGETYMSPRMKELLGLSPEERPVRGEALAGLASIHPDDRGALNEAIRAHLDGRLPAFSVTLRVRPGPGPSRDDGGWRHVRCRGQALGEGPGTLRLCVGTAYDVSAEVAADEQAHRMQEQLQRARRLEALGTLAGGVAHDFNNILAAVLGYGERARAAVAEGTPVARHMDHVLLAGRRGKVLVERVLSFTRGGVRVRQPFRVQPVIEEVLDLLSASVPARVTVTHRLDAPQAVAVGDSTALFEATMNLCSNGLQAMPQGGELAVSLTVEESTEPRVLWQGLLAPGAWVHLSVADSGTGIGAEALPHLFEPFFTTKSPHLGTGLGLAVVHGMVSDMGGAIDVATWPGRGSRFDLYLPLHHDASGMAAAADSHVPRGRGQVVMVVDDEVALVELVEEQLAELGYDPRGFSDPLQALQAFDAHPGEYDLVITDQAMPQLTGIELAGKLRQRRPELPVLMVSGFGGPGFAARAESIGVAWVVHKPLERAELARAIDRALRQPPALPLPGTEPVA